MKNASLLLSTALASLIVLAPATLTSADAATIKIKPQVLKVKPKIAVAKPKVRVKVKAARVRVTPKLRVKVKPKIVVAKPKLRVKLKPKIKAASIKPRVKVKAKAPKIVTTLKATPKIAAPALNIKPRIKVQALAKAIGKVKPVAIIKPQVKVASTPPKATIRQTGAAAVVDRVVIPSGIKDAAQGARVAAAARDAIKVSVQGVKVTGKLGSELGAIDIASTAPRTNRDIINSMFKQPKGGQTGTPGLDGKWGNHGVGNINADNFVGLPNTHSPAGTDPNTAAGGAMAYWNGKRDGDLAGAIAGVAGDQDGVGVPSKGWTKNRMNDGFSYDVRNLPNGGNGGAILEEVTIKNRPDGSTTVITNTYHDVDGDGAVDAADQQVRETNDRGHVTDETFVDRPDLVERRDPEHSDGGSTPFWWVNEREKGTFDFSKVGSGGKSPGAMPQNPHGEDGAPRTQRVVSQNDLVERYDEDSRNRTGGTALSQQDLCAHSEC